jgi:outer membrane autotransporter protein
VTISGGSANSSDATIDTGGEIDVSGPGTVWTDDGSSPGFGLRGGAIVVGESGAGTLLIGNGAAVITNGSPAGTVLIGNLSGSTGTVTVGNGNGNSTLMNTGPSGLPGNFYVGYEGSGTLNVNAGGSVSGFDGMDVGVATGSTGIVNVDGGSLDVSEINGGLTVGRQGKGTVSVTNGGQLTSYIGFIGSGAGSAGSSATVDGSGSIWNITGTGLKVGLHDEGALTIRNGGIVNFDSSPSEQLYVSNGSGSGTLTIDGGQLNAEGAQAFIGVTGPGSANLTVENGGILKTSTAYVGGGSASQTGNATVLISGTGSLWDVTLDASRTSVPGTTLLIANPTGGTAVAVRDGGKLISGFTEIGNDGQAGFTTNLTIDGAGSSWVSPYEDIIGYEGSYAVGQTAASAGSVTISGGATASSATMIVGRITDTPVPNLTNDQLTITGVGSKLTVSPTNTLTGALDIGYLGSGQMTVAAGGAVQSDHAIIGYSSAAPGLWSTDAPMMNSFGAATVTGVDSSWAIDNSLIVGDNATGTANGRLGAFAIGTGSSQGSLTISDGASVTDASAAIAANSRATGLVTVTGNGSTWATTGNVQVGVGGSGSVSVLNGGAVSASDIQVYAQGVLSIDTGSIDSDIDGGSAGVGALLTSGGTSTVSGNVGVHAPLSVVGVLSVGSPTALTIDGSLAATTTSISQDAMLSIGTGGAIGAVESDINDDGALIVDHSDDVTLAGSISGAGSLNLQGTGSFTINGSSNTLSGVTTVSGGTLIVGDDAHHGAGLAGAVSVGSGGTLGGHGTVGTTDILAGGTLAPGASIGTLTVDGDLTIHDDSDVNFEFGAPGANFNTPGQSDHVAVTGNLSIGSSTLTVTNTGSMGPGLYNLFTWGGSLSIVGGGFAPPPGMSLQVLSVDRQINLIDTQTLTLNMWDANGQAGPGQMGGGSGTWSIFSNTWADTTGQFVGPMAPEPSFAIFGGASGTVTVDDGSGAVSATGLQFVSDGYHLTGDALTLIGANGDVPVIRVGDGDTAIIDNVIDSLNGIDKTDGGTLVLNGANVYGGNTVLGGGELSVSSDVNLGLATNAIDFEGGTLQVAGTGLTSTGRDIIWGNSGGGFDIADVNNNFSVSQQLNGPGGLVKTGAGTLTLSGTNGYSGDTRIAAGTLVAQGGNAIGDQSAVSVVNGAIFRVLDDETVATLSGSGSTVDLDGANLKLVSNSVSATTAYSGSITGSGSLIKDGAFTQVLSGNNNYQGETQILDGTLYAVGTGTDSIPDASDVTIASGGTLSLAPPLVPVPGEEGDDETIGSLAGAGDVNLGGQTLTVGGNGASTTFSGMISGTGALVKTGTGTLTLSGSNRYSGGTQIDGGMLSASVDENLGDAHGALDINGGTFQVTGSAFNNTARPVTFGAAGATIDVAQQFVSVQMDGAIDGSGSLIKTGAGTLTLNGVNTYTGTTTVSDGALVIGDETHPNASIAGGLTVADGATLGGEGTLGSSVTIADGATLAPGNSPGTLTINGNLTLSPGSNLSFDFGQADVAGGRLNDLVNVSGDLVLDGTLTTSVPAGGFFGPGVYRLFGYGGTLTNNGLDLARPAAGISVQTSIANQVNLVNTAGEALTYWDGAGPAADGRVDGGSGTWQVIGGSGWTDEAGKLNGAYTDGSFAIFAGTAGTVRIDTSPGNVTVSGMQFAADGYVVEDGAIALTGTQATIRVGDGTAAGANYVATIASDLVGAAGLAKDDLGTLVLTGPNSYTGPTDILAGKLVVNSMIDLSAVAVHDGATLGGNGTVGATAVQSGGTIAPGNSIGTLQVDGSYSQAAGAIYQAEVDPTSSASDRIAVAGTANLADGAILNVTKTTDAPYTVGSKYTVLTTTGGLAGSFDITGATDLSAFLGLVGSYDANNAYLAVTQTHSIASAGRTFNQRAVGSGLDSLPPTSAVTTPILNLPSTDGVPQILDQLSGEIHASAQTALMEDSRFARDAATDRIREAFCSPGARTTTGNGAKGAASASHMPADCAGNTDHATSWTQAIGSWGHTDGDANAATIDRSIGGFFAGVDVPVSDSWRVGALAGYTRTNFNVDARNASGSSDDYHIGLYGGTQAGPLGIRAGAIYSWHDISTRRSVAFPGFSDSLDADYHAGTTQIFGDLGYRIDAGAVAFEPFANLAYVDLHTNGFDEKGADAALGGRSASMDTTFTTVGVRGSTAFTLGGIDLSANSSIGWRHAMGDVTPSSTLAFGGGDTFGVAGVPVAKDAAIAEVGLDMRIAPNATLGFSYNGQFGSHANDQGVRGTLQVKF